MITWRESVAGALNRLARRKGTRIVTRQELIERELGQIVRETACAGLTPEQTLSRVLQDLRDDHQIEFLGRGQYRILVPSVH